MAFGRPCGQPATHEPSRKSVSALTGGYRAQRCGRDVCNPQRMRREGADHHGIDVFIRCNTCGREGPYVECVKTTPEVAKMVVDGWNEDLRSGG